MGQITLDINTYIFKVYSLPFILYINTCKVKYDLQITFRSIRFCHPKMFLFRVPVPNISGKNLSNSMTCKFYRWKYTCLSTY